MAVLSRGSVVIFLPFRTASSHQVSGVTCTPQMNRLLGGGRAPPAEVHLLWESCSVTRSKQRPPSSLSLVLTLMTCPDAITTRTSGPPALLGCPPPPPPSPPPARWGHPGSSQPGRIPPIVGSSGTEPRLHASIQWREEAEHPPTHPLH